MKNIAVINAVFTAPHAFLPLAGKESAAEAAVAFAGRLPDTADIAVLTSHNHKVFASCRTVKKADWDGRALLAALKDLCRGYDNVFYFFADCPFLDTALAARMYEHHLKYFSDYTFADGYPGGLAVEIVKSPVFEPLVELSREGDPANRETLFETGIQKGNDQISMYATIMITIRCYRKTPERTLGSTVHKNIIVTACTVIMLPELKHHRYFKSIFYAGWITAA